ncbi:dynein regulatory complex subunit 2 isoform X1 [Chiroxiphia lanceolata]|uniref:dynein regulatory complex subunit 2 isoform X1 n=1 Tax=Chiroxiphia lanceolata TaxID=296741 RepID=UPI0013CF2C7F|nr:dynein regulatory complex subunit 2 isoform X1 [Chiroxiphia lanceolata]XP_032569576.1 dynein regulatory complex subunit 2 isoform X1 [Chiroxiphia lanceolata]
MAGARPGAPGAAEAELLLLQSQALAEEEAAKTRRELLTRFLQDKLSREQQLSSGGLHKLRTLWRSALRHAKDQELRGDIETLSQTFSQVMDCKDGVIEALLRELEEAEEQQSRALRSHLSLTDQLLQLQRCRLGYLEEGFAAQEDHPEAAGVGKLVSGGHGTGHGAGPRQDRPRGHAGLPERPGRHQKQELAGAAVQPPAAGGEAGGAVEADPEGPAELQRGHGAQNGRVQGAAEEVREELPGDRGAVAEAAEAAGHGGGHQGPDRGSRPGERGADPAGPGGEGRGPAAAPGAPQGGDPGGGRGSRRPGHAQLPERGHPQGAAAGGGEGSTHPAPGRDVPQAGDGGGEGAALLPLLAGRGGAAGRPQSPGGDPRGAPGTGRAGLRGAGEVLAEVQQGEAGGEGAGADAGGPGKKEPAAAGAAPAVPGGGLSQPEGAQGPRAPPRHQARATSPEMSPELGRGCARGHQDTAHPKSLQGGVTPPDPILSSAGSS